MGGLGTNIIEKSALENNTMKTTETKKRGRPVGSKNKFKTNEFAKKYKEELAILDDFSKEIVESVDQVKSWKRSPTSQTVNLTYLFLAFIIGFSVCAIVVTPIIISAI